MEVRYFKGYSYNLNREMEFKVYGHRGKPVLFIPCQAGRFYDFENFHMDDVFRPYIDAGEIMVFSIDTIDNETWADHGGNPRARIEQHERWFNYIVDEMVPQIRQPAVIRPIKTNTHRMVALFSTPRLSISPMAAGEKPSQAA